MGWKNMEIKQMKKLLAIIILSLCFITPSQADDIRDFQIEGISIGDSLLDYLSKKEIFSGKQNYYKSDEFIPVYIDNYKNYGIAKWFC